MSANVNLNTPAPDPTSVQADAAGVTTSRDAGIPMPELKSRIDPSSIVVDWDVAAVEAETDHGPEAVFGRPRKDGFVRAHPAWSTGVYLIDCRSAVGFGAEYVLAHAVAKALLLEDQPVVAAQIHLLAVHGGGWIFWPLKLGDPTEVRKPAQHVTSALAALAEARKEWVKIFWRNGRTSGWRWKPAKARLDDPTWPEDPLTLFLETIADRFIDSLADPVIKAYLGEI